MNFIWWQTLPCEPPWEPQKYWNFSSKIKYSLSKYAYIYDPFLNFWHEISGKLDLIGKNGFDNRVQQEKIIGLVNSLSGDSKKSLKNGGECYIHPFQPFFGNESV